MVDFCLPLLTLLCVQLFLSDQSWKASYIWLGVLSGIFLLLSTQLLGGYSRYLERSIAKKLEITFKAWLSSILVLSFAAYLDYSIFSFARSVILMWVVITPSFVFLLKFVINRKSRSTSHGRTEVLVLGNGYSFNEFEFAYLEKHNIRLHTIIEFNRTVINERIETLSPDFLVINLDKSAEPKLIKVLTRLDLKGVNILTLHSFMESFLRKCYIPYESVELSYLGRIQAYNRLSYMIKRVVDISVCLGLVSLVWPVMLFSVYKIKKQSPGRVFFKQARVGLQGKEFQAIKFRSMHENSEFNPYTQEKDPRIFPFGNVMRRTRIDELPQLWNVFVGDMHLFGPRTEWNILVEEYEHGIPYYHERHLVRPGISGWAQVLYPYGGNIEDARQKLMYDLYYIKYWSIWLEVETLIRTVSVVLRRKGL
ncbi:exopolysaccharide biosynthesis polyprenyl glycosylphosphotransferase [Marinomonas sp. 2405UD66-6]|uniref:exopolysaccharide biosynthesis polyprenyl glycosylphosphotransferase n=1 Tax=Marinomonas sp. 2405UD66-6 TaxID=3391834 RepID=UPI0039C96E3F